MQYIVNLTGLIVDADSPEEALVEARELLKDPEITVVFDDPIRVTEPMVD